MPYSMNGSMSRSLRPRCDEKRDFQREKNNVAEEYLRRTTVIALGFPCVDYFFHNRCKRCEQGVSINAAHFDRTVTVCRIFTLEYCKGDDISTALGNRIGDSRPFFLDQQVNYIRLLKQFKRA